MAEVVAPTNRDGDRSGRSGNADGSVVTPDSFKPAYAKWVESGFGAMPFDPDVRRRPASRGSRRSPCRRCSPRPTWRSRCARCSRRGRSTRSTLTAPTSRRPTYLPKMMTGEWTGTMNLTEPQAGSDVGAVAHQGRTAAERRLVARSPVRRSSSPTASTTWPTTSSTSSWRARPDRPRARRGSRCSSCRSSSSNADGSLGDAQRRDAACRSNTSSASTVVADLRA